MIEHTAWVNKNGLLDLQSDVNITVIDYEEIELVGDSKDYLVQFTTGEK
jgi:hypothetical protein